MRQRWIDNTKGLAILLIICAHVIQYSPVFSVLNSFICSFHVAVFFMMSGYVERMVAREWKWKRQMTLLVPYFLFSTINALLKIGVLWIQHKLTRDIVLQEIMEFLFIGNGTVWFIQCLFLVRICKYLLIDRYIKKDGTRIMIALLCIVISYSRIVNDDIILIIIVRTMAALGFYLLGFSVKAYDNYWLGKKRVCIVSLFVGIFLFKLFNCSILFFKGMFNQAYADIAVSACMSLGIMNVFFITSKRCKYTFLNYMGKNSLIVMLVHPILLQVIMYPLGSRIGQLTGLTAMIVIVLIYLLLCIMQIPCICIINRFFPWAIGKQKKKEENARFNSNYFD